MFRASSVGLRVIGLGNSDMREGCQSPGPFEGTVLNTAPHIWGIQKKNIIFDSAAFANHCVSRP